MTSDRHHTVMRILGEVLDHPASERESLLERLCAGDRELRQEIDNLLRQQDVAARFLETPPVPRRDWDGADDDLAPIGETVGVYRLIHEIGRGGVGAVFLAKRDDDQYQRHVAIKLIKRGMDTDAIQRRFRRERQILANFDHPYIATLFDGGATPDGRPYLVMEYVDGEPITRYASARQLDEAGRLKLFLDVCQAVQYAHQQGVVHGDIKPGNILVTRDGIPKLLDFGIARILNPSAASSDATTGARRPLTPDYASPEQLRHEPITAASDVYSLGAVLHELLAGKPTAPQRPPVPLMRDLGTIVQMALRDDPERRYSSVAALADDLARYREGRPVSARPDRLGYRVRSFARRRKAALSAGAAGAIACLLLGVWLTWLALRPPPARSIAVLPFSTAASDPASEVLSDGITDSLIGEFARMALSRTPARDSVFRLKGQQIVPKDVAAALHVDTLLMGRVSASGDRVSIEVSLFDAARNRIAWNRQYDSRLTELLSLHDQIVADVSRQLNPGDKPDARMRVRPRHTPSDVAYRHYLVARSYWNTREPAQFRNAIDEFRKAIARDPEYALAHSGLADSYGLLGAYMHLPAHEAFPAAKGAALQAIALDKTLPEARTSLALVLWLYDWDWEKSEAEFRQAIALDPRFVRAHHWYALFLGEMARAEEAAVQMRLALELDPLSPSIWGDFARLHFWARQYDKSRELYQQAFQMLAGSPFISEALEVYERTDPEAFLRMRVKLGYMDDREVALYRTQGPRAFWRQHLQRILMIRDSIAPMDLVEAYVRSGDADGAFVELNAAFRMRDHRLTQLKVNPVLDPLRDDPRFDELLERMNLTR